MKIGLHAAAVVLGLFACAPAGETAHGLVSQRVIYGEDERRDVFAVEDEALRRVALRTTAALIPGESLRRTETGELEHDAPTLTEKAGLCASEPFGGQPSLAECSGVLVDRDLVLTAAHCTGTQFPCERQRWVFDYALVEPSSGPALHERNVYRCRSVPVREYDVPPIGVALDYAFVQLDRPVDGTRETAALASDAVATGDRLTVIGYPHGLPAKVDVAAKVLGVRPAENDYFALASDTFVGSSGSGVFNARRELVGTLVRGGIDYDYDPDGGCFVSRRLSDDSEAQAGGGGAGGSGAELDGDTPPGEQASYAARSFDALCGSGWASPALCARASACGDGQCSLDEHDGSCVGDCPALPVFSGVKDDATSGCGFAARPSRRDSNHGGATLILLLGARWMSRRSDLSSGVRRPCRRSCRRGT